MRSVGLTKGLTGSLRSLRAGEVREFTDVVDQARRTALERLSEHAQQLGGNAVLGVRFDSSTSATAWPRSSPTAPPPPSVLPDPAGPDATGAFDRLPGAGLANLHTQYAYTP